MSVLELPPSPLSFWHGVRYSSFTMISGKRVACILPAYNAEKTLERTLRAVPEGVVGRFILVDDSTDDTARMAARLSREFPLEVIVHEKHLGYGGNQTTCYRAALRTDAEVVVMLHPDYQYEPRLLGSLADLVASGIYDVALGSRILGGGALRDGMPLYKYVSNRFPVSYHFGDSFDRAETFRVSHRISGLFTACNGYPSIVCTFRDFGSERLVFRRTEPKTHCQNTIVAPRGELD